MDKIMKPDELRKWRGKKSQRDAANLLSISYETYRSYETGRRRMPTWMRRLIKTTRSK